MAEIRSFTARDAPEVAAIRRKAFRSSSWTNDADLEAYIRRIFLSNPWVDPGLPSLVHVESDGRITGFLGIVPRPLRLGNRTVEGAVATQFMVAEEATGFAAWSLLRSAFEGPQDFLMADVGNGTVHPLWQRLGGAVSPLYCLHWKRILRPATARLAQGRQSRIGRAIEQGSRPVLGLADRLLRGGDRVLRDDPPGSRVETATIAEVSSSLALLGRRGHLQAAHDEESLNWLLREVREKWREGRLEWSLVKDGDGEVVGFFVYVLRNGTAEVLQVISTERAARDTLLHLFQHAADRSASAVDGRLEPTLLPELGVQRCTFRYATPGMLVHSRDTQLITAVLEGRSLLSGLDGEWWLNF